MNSKTKVTLSITAMVMVTLIAVVSIIAVFAARTQNFSSQVSVKYTASQITGKVTANYYIGPDDTTGTPMKNKSGGTELRFEPNESLDDYLNPDGPIELFVEDNSTEVPTPDKSWVVFEYCFQNGLGKPVTTDYMAKLNFTGTAENIKITTRESDTKLDSSEFSKILSRMAEPSNFGSQLVVVEHNEAEDYTSSKYFYVKAEIDNWGADSTFEGDFTWDLSLFKPTENLNLTMSGDHYVVAGSNGEISGDLIIPNEYNGTPVTEIGDNAFQNNTSITNIYIPNGITTIGANAFDGCSNAVSLTVGEDVATINNSPFIKMSKLSFLNFNAVNATVSGGGYGGNGIFNSSGHGGPGIAAVFGDKVQTILAYMFAIGGGGTTNYPKVVSIVLGKSVETIGTHAFESSQVTANSIYIPASVKNIEKAAFRYNNITTLIVDKGNSIFTSRDKDDKECNIIIDKTTKTLIAGLNNSIIPDDGSIERIREESFYYCNLENITIPQSIIAMENWAFTNCDILTNITINSQYVCNNLVEWNTGLEDCLQVGGTIRAKYEIANFLDYYSNFSQSETQIDGYWIYTRIS